MERLAYSIHFDLHEKSDFLFRNNNSNNILNFGSCDYTLVENYTNYNGRSFFEFALGSIDPNCITSANLMVTHYDDSYWGEGGSDFSFGAHRVTGSWNEGVECYDDQSNPALSWKNGGGDYDSYVYATAVGGKNDPDGTQYNLDITTLVKDWLIGTYPNYGVALVSTSNTGSSWFSLYSDDAANVANRPKLIIDYSCPAEGDYVIEIDLATLPQGNTVMTTDNVETASFGGLGEIDCYNDFGYVFLNK